MQRSKVKNLSISKTGQSYNHLSLISLTLGLILIGVFAVYRYHQVRILSFNTTEIEKIEQKSGITPVHIRAYPVGVDIEIQNANITNGLWTIHPDTASYLVTSAGIGDNNNIIVYGHNKDVIMGPIRYVAIGALIEVIGSDGEVYEYEVVKKDIVKPDNLSYLKPTEEETLTIYTCTGFLDSERFIAVAKRKK